MAKALAVPEIPGVEDIWSLLAFLGDVEAYGARLRALQAYADQIRALLTQIAGAEEVETARIQARTDRQMAAEELAQAKAQAVALIGTAMEDRDAAVAAAAQARHALDAERVEFEMAAATARADVAADMHAVAVRETAAALILADGQAMATEAMALKSEYEARLARLEAGIAAARG